MILRQDIEYLLSERAYKYLGLEYQPDCHEKIKQDIKDLFLETLPIISGYKYHCDLEVKLNGIYITSIWGSITLRDKAGALLANIKINAPL